MYIILMYKLISLYYTDKMSVYYSDKCPFNTLVLSYTYGCVIHGHFVSIHEFSYTKMYVDIMKLIFKALRRNSRILVRNYLNIREYKGIYPTSSAITLV